MVLRVPERGGKYKLVLPCQGELGRPQLSGGGPLWLGPYS